MSNITESKTSLGLLGIAGVEAYVPEAGEPYLSDRQKEHFKIILTKWKDHLKREVGNPDALQLPLENLADMTDRASQEEEFNLELTACDRDLKQIAKIEKGLLRLMNDEFGFCDGCGEEIGLKRLEARPTAELCIECQTLAELAQRQ